MQHGHLVIAFVNKQTKKLLFLHGALEKKLLKRDGAVEFSLPQNVKSSVH